MPNFLNNPVLKRGLRNNNPGNLRRLPYKDGKPQYWNGEIPYANSQDASFSQFIEIKYGIRAMMKDIYADYTKGKNTVTKLIGEYAPATENNTVAYINSVAKAIGVSPTGIFTLTADSLIAITKIITIVENGADQAAYIGASDYDAAFAISGIPLKKKKVQ